MIATEIIIKLNNGLIFKLPLGKKISLRLVDYIEELIKAFLLLMLFLNFSKPIP